MKKLKKPFNYFGYAFDDPKEVITLNFLKPRKVKKKLKIIKSIIKNLENN